MSEHRIYERKQDIKVQNIIDFYNERAKRADKMECPYTAVLLGDQNQEYAKKWDTFEKEYILEQLKIDESCSVLDVGCGIGRWAEALIPNVNYYLGTDFSCEMINTAKNRCVFENRSYDFMTASFQELAENYSGQHKFNRVIIGGVCMYINDADLKLCMDKLGDLLDEHCIMYFTETVAVEKRLTLDEFPSEALKTTYDVIYRTPDEYNEYYKVFLENGFKTVKQEYLPHLNNDKKYSETERWYTVFER